MPTKWKLRQYFRQILQHIPHVYREQSAQKAAHIFVQQPEFQHSQTIAIYLAYRDEFDSAPLIEQIWRAKKRCYLPILDADQKILSFVEYAYGDPLQRNQFKILEPRNRDQIIDINRLDCIIAPLIAFDLTGNRLGTGGGYYDRTLAKSSWQKGSNKIIGLGFAAQCAEQIPNDPWDISLDAVITEQKFVRFVVKDAK